MADEIAEEVVETTEAEVEVEEAEEPKESEAEEPEKEPEAEEVIPVRSNASYIIQRQKAQIEKLRSEKAEEEDPETIEARLERIEQMAFVQADDRDLVDFFEKEPEAKKYESRIKAYMGH